MNILDIAHQRLHNQHIAGTLFEKPADAVAWLGAVQAQDYAGAKWAVGQRVQDATDAAIDQAFAEGKILRTHVMRPTWHFVTPADIRWMLELTAPRVHRAMAYYRRQNGLDESLLNRATTAFERALRDGHCLTRAELGAQLERAGLAAKGVRLALITLYAE